MRAPAAAAMFVLADRLGLSAERLAAPATATALASTALRDLNPWTGQAATNRARALALVQPLRDLVTAVVTDLRNAWWSAPLDRGAQLLLTGQDDPRRDPMQLQPPHGPIDAWESYAQTPLRGIATSTELPVAHDAPIRSGAHAELACGSSDWDAVYPVHQVRLRVSPPPASMRSTPPRTGTASSSATGIGRRAQAPTTTCVMPLASTTARPHLEQGRRRLRRSPPQLGRLAHRPVCAPHHRGGQHHLVGVELGEYPLAAVGVHQRHHPG